MEEQPGANSKSKIIATVVVVAILGILIGATVVANGRKDDKSPVVSGSEQRQATSQEDADNSGDQTKGTYKDGTYSATGSYSSPGGNERVDVKVTIKNGEITDADVTARAASPTSSQYQDQFIAGYKQQVVGKNVDEVSLSTVSGSSLTPQGFNEALEVIKQQAIQG